MKYNLLITKEGGTHTRHHCPHNS